MYKLLRKTGEMRGSQLQSARKMQHHLQHVSIAHPFQELGMKINITSKTSGSEKEKRDVMQF